MTLRYYVERIAPNGYVVGLAARNNLTAAIYLARCAAEATHRAGQNIRVVDNFGKEHFRSEPGK